MKINVKHVAKLANLDLKENEFDELEKQLSLILSYIENLQELNTEDIEETSQITGLKNITREDKTEPSLSQEEVLSNTKSKENGLFKVKAIFEEQ